MVIVGSHVREVEVITPRSRDVGRSDAKTGTEVMEDAGQQSAQQGKELGKRDQRGKEQAMALNAGLSFASTLLTAEEDKDQQPMDAIWCCVQQVLGDTSPEEQ
ncbi:uncharacterized protein [Aegilops tauschii subsp. strangulata]|uniref:uncharacterized protein isoform X2 n=1 Tax=Triticum aestivum TaxID=4565 RepID=UPI001D0122CA|nr:uncharacterized protein LOC123163792 isoform X2 [Triticum aestivum]XP_045087944.1 uncharacterized protein LOC109779155 isoform X2 [Aegilops tauschii subsp. strangulata]